MLNAVKDIDVPFFLAPTAARRQPVHQHRVNFAEGNIRSAITLSRRLPLFFRQHPASGSALNANRMFIRTSNISAATSGSALVSGAHSQVTTKQPTTLPPGAIR